MSAFQFQDLIITNEHYHQSPENPDYYLLEQELLLSLRTEFEKAIVETFPASEWEVATGEIPWDSGTMGVKVTPLIKDEPSRRSFILDYGVSPYISHASLSKQGAESNAIVRVRIIIFTNGDYSGLVCDHDQSGIGWYNPKRWAEDALEMMTGYLFHGQSYHGY